MLHPKGEALLREHSEREFGSPSFSEVAPGVWFAFAMASANAIVVEGADGCILIDALDSLERGQALRKAIDTNIGKPVHTIIYTHIHADHRDGAGAFEDTVNEVIAFTMNASAPPGLAKIGPVFLKRIKCQFGTLLPDELVFSQGTGIRPGNTYGEKAAPLPPTTYYTEDVVSRTIDGVEFELHLAPGESGDQCFVWLPDKRILASADNYYACFPNLYALRGTVYREVADWIDALDKLLKMEAEILLPGHTCAIFGKEKIREVLTNYRDAVKFIYDETLACLAKDMTIDETVEAVQLPEHLRDLPYLGEFYGTAAWSVRSIYTGHVGWFDGNPTNIEPLRLRERAQKTIALAGGEEAFRQAIRDALYAQEYQWAAELCDHLLNLNKKDSEARLQKAEALDALARQETSANGRNYYLTHARILRGELPEDLSGDAFA